VQRNYHERVRHSARHLLGLIGEVLDLSKVESGRLTVHRERVTLLREGSAALALVRPQAAARRLRLIERTLCDGEVAAWADAGRVRQVLLNLLSNAVKFTPEGGMVLLECGQASDHVWMRVVDTGIGIPEEQLEQVFEPFVQARDDATSPYRRTQGGTGLGLSISRQLARLMRGDLVVESTPGLGSTFTLRLPMWDRASRDGGRQGVVAGDGVPRHVRVALGSTLAACADHIVKTWADRLRVDPEVPQARDRADAEIEDHVGAFLADFAQHFVILDEPGVDRASLVGDGVKIQRMIAELHGTQRARLGWTESALVRELRMLVEEIDRTMREKLGTAGELEDSLALVRAFLRDAGRETIEAFRVARAVRAARDAA
jgi:anti-sigma regulatory factor (Ser/Thr protein kinase)